MKLTPSKIFISSMVIIGILTSQAVVAKAADNSSSSEVERSSSIDMTSSQSSLTTISSSSSEEISESSVKSSSSSASISNSEDSASSESDSSAPEVTSKEDTADNDFFRPGTRSNLHPVPSMRSSLPTIYPTDPNRPEMDFVDVSSNNGDISVAEFKKMKSYGITGVVVKLTESTSYINSLAKSQIANAKAAGLTVSAYHYSWFTTDAQAIKEADYFAAAAANLGLSKSIIMANDLEDPQIIGKGNHTSNSLAFQSELKRLGYTNVYHYVSKSLVQYGQINANTIGSKNFWIAQYLYDPTPNSETAIANQAYGAWQWSPQLLIPGVSGYFDISIDYTGAFTSSAPAQGPWIAKDGYATVTKKYNMYSNFNWAIKTKAADNYEKTYKINGMYHHANGSTYYSLYGGKSGKWYGYINANAVKVTSVQQGAVMPASGYATVLNNYDIWGNFNWVKKVSAADAYQKTYQIKYKYGYADGRVFYSLYDNSGTWVGYINAKGVKVASGAQGTVMSTSGYATIVKHNYNLWGNFSWNKINVSAADDYQKTYQIKYFYNHINGKTYYSLYDNNNKWAGYVTSLGTKVSQEAQGTAIATADKVKIVKHNYGIWTGFNWKQHAVAPNDAYGKTYQAKYFYNHTNGTKYYSLYQGSRWLGYISALGVQVIK